MLLLATAKLHKHYETNMFSPHSVVFKTTDVMFKSKIDPGDRRNTTEKPSSDVYLDEYLTCYKNMNYWMSVKYHLAVSLAHSVTTVSQTIVKSADIWMARLIKAEERCRILFVNVLGKWYSTQSFSAGSMYRSHNYLRREMFRAEKKAFRRCWIHTQRLFLPGSSHQTTSHWPWWRGWRSSGCDHRLAAGWCPSPSSWSAHWSLFGPTTGRQSLCHWCPTRCAPLGQCSDERSCKVHRSRILT